MIKTRRLLVLDKQHDTEEVLKAVLEPAGTEVMRVNTWQQLQNCEPEQKGTVLVLHENSCLESHPEAASYLQTPRVIIGRIEPANVPEKEQQLDDLFEFNDLLHAIESLWEVA